MADHPNVKRLEDEIKLLKIELQNREVKGPPQSMQPIFKQMMKSLFHAKVVCDAMSKRDEETMK